MNINILIATSGNRTNWLINKSLISVYKQCNIDPKTVSIWIVDDNENKNEFRDIKKQVYVLRNRINIPENHFRTSIIRNKRTRFMSGSGAWNTGIFEIAKFSPESYISILDDDDEYLPNHLSDCYRATNENVAAVFQSLTWINSDNSKIDFFLKTNLITPEKFFIGNPGIQGSNMFFKTKYLRAINGFNENLPNTTDRDLMIRFLWHIQKHNNATSGSPLTIKVLGSIGVIHHNHNKLKVNNNYSLKQEGLDLFYGIYRPHFSETAYLESIIRANKLFNYQPS